MLNKTEQTVNRFIESVYDFPWMGNTGNIQDNWRVFETSNEAYEAIKKNRRHPCHSIVEPFDKAGSAALDVIFHTRWYEFIKEAMSKIEHYIGLHTDLSGYYIFRTYIACLAAGDFLDPQHMQAAEDVMNVWRSGYGYAGSVDGVLYVFKEFSENEGY